MDLSWNVDTNRYVILICGSSGSWGMARQVRGTCWEQKGLVRGSKWLVPDASSILTDITWDEVFLRQHDFIDGWFVNCECLEDLWSLAESLWMLNNNTHCSTPSPIGDLYPITTQTYKQTKYSMNLFATVPEVILDKYSHINANYIIHI